MTVLSPEAVRPSDAPTPDVDRNFADSILAGLTAPRKTIESKWFYDVEGSRLFDAITTLEEYYPTRIETGILEQHAPDLAALLPPDAALVELGSGSSVKTRLVLDALPGLSVYVPIDISAVHLDAAARALSADYPEIDVQPLAADFTDRIVLPAALAERPKLLFFPGSTIGNFDPDGAHALLGRLRALPRVTGFVIGFDLIKDESVLVRAYDDSKGVTAAFNLNLLVRINRELGADFDLGAFRHEARWNRSASRIEMHLVSRRPQTVSVLGRRIAFAADESIHTENSHKYSVSGFREFAASAGWRTYATWTDAKTRFGVSVLLPD